MLGFVRRMMWTVVLLVFFRKLPIRTWLRIACCQLACATPPLPPDASRDASQYLCTLPPSRCSNLQQYSRLPVLSTGVVGGTLQVYCGWLGPYHPAHAPFVALIHPFMLVWCHVPLSHIASVVLTGHPTRDCPFHSP